ncbi:hypothetical protein SNOG_16147 [Parastagonospora nodorum SN15]|uniref:Major facilitator superfamily (MFS) profile domain-containing protein n=1 Tax=Phaeosphaeria nodorum (strain SN15 / ATCC MYA-4574 / FGSC 10173) TaxID=321614 RepID=Q0TWL7_PHANO|nr:hypothetical protein SNOG_16147 [Parastagonospora nodorum SN15]EAT76519.1 hypothetical protein SNOG_16147 [Parastagonospora nodorum SN15]KAH4892272.1 hypothetical protein HBH74_211920 [Parastagonospora nodorum]KAH6482492.1 hypothetical protein HBI55_234020 [Parastagonospora nodorum]
MTTSSQPVIAQRLNIAPGTNFECINRGARGFWCGPGRHDAQLVVVSLGLAVGIASFGSSLGGVMYPIVLRTLVYEIGFAWAIRVIGFMALAPLIIPCVVMKERVKPAVRKRRPMIDYSAFTNAT